MMGFGVRMKVVVAVLVFCGYGISVAWGQYSQAGWLNIDCGSNKSYTDPVTGIMWQSDEAYINTGTTGSVSGFVSFQEAQTLRYFGDPRAKNCYTLPVTPNTTYILRATFFYNNYDNAATPPTFKLAIDGTYFDEKVVTDADTGIFREVFFKAQSNATFLCLVRDLGTNPTVPFVSAITLKPYLGKYLGFDQYFASNMLIRTEQRQNFGGTGLIRFPDDPFDRYWFPQGTDTTFLQSAAPLKLLTTTQPISNTKNSSFNAPWPVLQSGLSTSGNINMTLWVSGGSSATSDVYGVAELVLYFAELNPAANVTSRAFLISVPGYGVSYDNPFNFTDPPAPFAAHRWTFWDLANVGPTYAVTLSPSPFSVEGPILNAMELFSVMGPAARLTVSRDALAIEAIKMDMNLVDWTGDPCLPVPHNWVNCSLDVATQQLQITSVDLSGYRLNGTISPSFAKLEALSALHLENNMLSGPLPNWLTSLTRLTELSVYNNNFSGQIPPGLIGANNLQFTYQPGNPELIAGNSSSPSPAPSSSPSSKTSSNIGVIVGAAIGGVFGFAAFFGLIFCCCVYKSPGSAKNAPKPEEMDFPDIAGVKAYSFAQVAAATNKFKQKIGSGGFGPVFYGELASRQEVAVKVADSNSHQGAAEFYNEVELLSKVHHRNLVALVGCCREGLNQILIYEFIDLGSLQEHLFGTSTRSAEALNWTRRLNIAVNAAQGLEYLHTGCIPGIIHRDVKSGNILLTSKAEVAKVADFGLSKLTSDENATHVSTLVKGTAGYLDPEYFLTNFLTFKSDVYSFGVVLLELLTGQPAVSVTPSQNRPAGSLGDWVRSNLSAGDINKILDPAVKASNPNLDGLWKVAELAVHCVEPKGVHRPSMSEVVQELRAALALEPTPRQESHSSAEDTIAFLSMGSLPAARAKEEIVVREVAPFSSG